MSKRKICVVTGSRADYGLLYWVLRDAQSDEGVDLQLAVTGMHLSPQFGLTVRDIERDGFAIDERVDMLLSGDSPVAIAKAIGLGVIGFADAFARLKPDLLVLLGDRFEILAAAQAAMVARIPIAHLHGGETTEGAIDEAIRHSITKMAHLHFVAAEPYRRRVIQMGEEPARVYNVGALGIDHVRRTQLLDRAELERSINFKLGQPAFLVTYHPATLAGTPPAVGVHNLLQALDRFPTARILFTRSNADTGGRTINESVDAYVARYPERTRTVTSLGKDRYVSALHVVDVVIGNSSSGIIEAPLVGVPTVNIGPRQRGRLHGPSVIDCSEDAGEIATAIERALSTEFKASLEGEALPAGDGEPAKRIVEVLRQTELGNTLIMKRFFDIPWKEARRSRPDELRAEIE